MNTVLLLQWHDVAAEELDKIMLYCPFIATEHKWCDHLTLITSLLARCCRDWQEKGCNLFAENVTYWLKVLFCCGKEEVWELQSGIKMLLLKVHINAKWREFYFELNSPILAWLNLQEMIGDLSLAVMNSIYWLNYQSIELSSVAFWVECDWMT